MLNLIEPHCRYLLIWDRVCKSIYIVIQVPSVLFSLAVKSPYTLTLLHRTVIIERPPPSTPEPTLKSATQRNMGAHRWCTRFHEDVVPEYFGPRSRESRCPGRVNARGVHSWARLHRRSLLHIARIYSQRISNRNNCGQVLSIGLRSTPRGRRESSLGRGNSARNDTLESAEKFVDSEEYRRKVEADQVPDPIHWPQFEQ